MRKLLQVIVCGIAAASFSAIAADEGKSTEIDANTKLQGDAKAGASADIKTDKKAKNKTKREKQGTSGAGGTKAEAAPAPAPTPTAPVTETPKKE